MARTATEKSPLSIDYPASGELLTGPHYSLRVSAGEHASVRVSIDGGPWRECRRASGYWWYDWSGYESGYHLISAQASERDGRIVALEARHVRVELGEDARTENPLSAAVIRRRRRHA